MKHLGAFADRRRPLLESAIRCYKSSAADKRRMATGQAPDKSRTSAGQDAEARGWLLAKANLSRRLRDGVHLKTCSGHASIRPDHSTLQTEIDVIRGPGSMPSRSARTDSCSCLTRWADRSSSNSPRAAALTTTSWVANVYESRCHCLRHTGIGSTEAPANASGA